MIDMKRIMALLILVATLLGAHAHAEDFSFSVPYEATNLPPEIRFLRVTCSVWRGGIPIGSGQYRVGVTGGTVRGEAIVTFNANKGQDPQRATRWTCGLIFDEDEAGEKSFAFSDASDSFPTVSRNITAQGDIEH